MQSLLFHPKVVHLPIALALLMPLVSSGIAIAWWRGWLPKRAWGVAIALQGILCVGGFFALQTGEAEEERVERVVGDAPLEEHEEAAEVFVWSSVGVFLLFVAAPLPRARHISLALAATAIAATVAILALGYRTGEAGGALVYEHGAAAAYALPEPISDVRRHEEDYD